METVAGESCTTLTALEQLCTEGQIRKTCGSECVWTLQATYLFVCGMNDFDSFVVQCGDAGAGRAALPLCRLPHQHVTRQGAVKMQY